MVVLDQEHNGRPVHRGKVERIVYLAGTGASIADHRQSGDRDHREDVRRRERVRR